MNFSFLRQAGLEPLGRRDSLAGRLTRTLIVWVGGVWLLCVLGVVWYVDREINHNFDNELVEVSHRMFDMAVQELEKLRHESPHARSPLIAPPQLFSTDPGRAAITGDPHDFESFDVPPLRGIANTAPYFHDNSAETLRDAVDLYSRFILPFFTMLNLPANLPPENGGFFPESLTPEQKADLLEFLQVL